LQFGFLAQCQNFAAQSGILLCAAKCFSEVDVLGGICPEMARKNVHTKSRDELTDLQAVRRAARSLFFLGWNQRSIAAALGTSEYNISRWKKDDRWEDYVGIEEADIDQVRSIDQDSRELQDYYMSLPIADRFEKSSKHSDAVLKRVKAKRSLQYWVPIDHHQKAVRQLLDTIRKADPELAKALLPHIEEHFVELNKEYRG
jgi:hypothetical protein